MENILIFDETNHRSMDIFSLPCDHVFACQLNKSELLNNLTMEMHQHEEWIIKGNIKVEWWIQSSAASYSSLFANRFAVCLRLKVWKWWQFSSLFGHFSWGCFCIPSIFAIWQGSCQKSLSTAHSTVKKCCPMSPQTIIKKSSNGSKWLILDYVNNPHHFSNGWCYFYLHFFRVFIAHGPYFWSTTDSQAAGLSEGLLSLRRLASSQNEGIRHTL